MISASGATGTQTGTQRNAPTGGPVRLGPIGCGGRGKYVATHMLTHADAQIVALADLASDRVDAAREQFDPLLKKRGLPPLDQSSLYRGADSAARVLQAPNVDAVLIAIIPYYYPDVLAQAVGTGKHIYCEKPLGTEVAGALRVSAS